jgi:hypothetical protein
MKKYRFEGGTREIIVTQLRAFVHVGYNLYPT